MKVLEMMPIGAAVFALSLGLSSVAPSPARADDDWGKGDKNLIRIVQEDQDNDRDSDRVSSSSGYLGVQVQRLSASLRRAKGIPEATEGSLVSNVEDQSPADDGGIKRGDVILEVNRQSTPSPNDLVRVVRDLEPGRRVPVQIWRDGVTRTVTLTVGTRPAGADAPPRAPEPPDARGDAPDPRDVPDVRSVPDVRGMPDMRGMPDGSRMQILRRNRDDLQRQLQDIHEMLSRLRDVDLARLEREIQQLRSELQRGGALERRNRDNEERDRGDRQRDQNERDNKDREQDHSNDGD
ncbi:MAG TPA: PDZ domain-containing protein [Candidatus Dormibacteraeota bacterium]|nr:PDZ domain-containing protein [Candidatus Dormibacteraeota bacterium]